MRTATLTNVDRAEYGTIIVDLDLLDKQIVWLAGLSEGFFSAERQGLLNLLGGIVDLADTLDADEVWEELGTIPVNDDGIIQEAFHHFPAGTNRETIWQWFEEEFGLSVHDLMFKKEAPDEARNPLP